MGKKSIAAATALTLIAVGAFAGISLAGKHDADGRTKVLKPVTGVASLSGGAGNLAAKPRAKKPTIQYFFARDRSVPAANGGLVTALRCPKGKGEPIAGGASTDVGIVVSYLSRVKPGSTPRTPARTYYVGVDDNSTTNSTTAGAQVEIQCAKGITVKHG